MKRLLSLAVAVVMAVSALPAAVFADDGIQREYDTALFTKISNPDAGPGEPDGINTNDTTGFEANRFNSYAWAVASRGDYIYIGTNRTLFGSALNALGETLRQKNPDLTEEKLNKLIEIVSGGDVPTIPDEETYIPQIIRFDVKNGTTSVIYQPSTARGEDGVLYYTDKDGNIIPGSDVVSETSSFRSVIEFKGNLYFGSLGTNMIQLVRVDENDNAEVVYQTLGLISSLRACCRYGEGEDETIYFGGQDTTYLPWRLYRRDNPDGKAMPILIRYLNPATAGSDNEDWSGIVADFNDFGKYAEATVYRNGGGTVWDLCSYNGKLYVILAYDSGWVMFRGEKAPGDEKANRFGWKWTEVVGDNGAYPPAMDAEIGEINEQLRQDYACSQYASGLTGTGLLESTATPYVFNGKMYIGTFDNATSVQSQTMLKLILKIGCMQTASETGDYGPTLEQIYAPIYEVLSHPQRVWVMDEDEKIAPVESANALLEGTTNDYVWRFVENNGKLYLGTFDSSSAYAPFLNLFSGQSREQLKEMGILPDDFLKQLDGARLRDIIDQIDTILEKRQRLPEKAKSALQKARMICVILEGVLEDGTSVEELMDDMVLLKELYTVIKETNPDIIPEDAAKLIDWLIENIDIEGLDYLANARALVNDAESGFDIFVTEDGENWEPVVRDGFGDLYNYGARTLTVHQGELYVGTANPYYGAQLWKMTELKSATVTFRVKNGAWDDLTTEDKQITMKGFQEDIFKLTEEQIPLVGTKPDADYTAGSWDVEPNTETEITEDVVYTYTFAEKPKATVTKAPEAKTLNYNGEAQELVTEGTAEGGELQYALGTASGALTDYTTAIPTGVNAGTYYVWYKVIGDKEHLDSEPVCVEVKIGAYTRKKGDVVKNDKVDNTDLIAVKSHIKKTKTLTGEDFWAADVDDNGVVNNTDLIAIKSHIKGTKKLW